MNLHRDTREDLRQFARQGRLRAAQPRMTLDAPRRVGRGSRGWISWRALLVDAVQLRITPPGEPVVIVEVHAEGRRRLLFDRAGVYTVELAAVPMRRGPARRRAHLRPITAEIDVVAPPPLIQFSAPRCVVLGAAAPISWRVLEAIDAQLLVGGHPQPVGLIGARDLPLGALGLHDISIVAVGDGGRAQHTTTIQVVAPPLAITAPATVSTLIGDIARFRYAIAGARTAWLDELDQDRPPYEIPLSGWIEVPTTLEPERLRIVAQGHTGLRVHKTIALLGRLFDPVNIAPELARLNRRAC